MKIITTDYENKKFWEETEKESALMGERTPKKKDTILKFKAFLQEGIELIIQLSTNNKVLCNSRKQIHFSAEQ